MKIKVFTAETMQEVMAKVKNELGIDAVILHTRRFHKGGIFGYLGKDMIEVTAAVEDKPPVKMQPAIAPETVVPKSVIKKYAESGNPIEDEQPAAEPKQVQAADKAADADAALSALAAAENAAEAATEELPEPKPKRVFKRKVRKKAEKVPEPEEVPSELSEDLTADVKKEEEKDSQIEQLQQELSDMKKMLEQVISTKKVVQTESVSLQRLLQDNEIESEIADEICSSILDEAVLANKDTPETKDFLSDYFERTFRPAKGIDLGSDKTKIVAFIGATGVGKTTTIAKVAAKFVLEKSASVALITADTYRISAVDQLKTYSDIVGVPLEIVYTPEELEAAIKKHSDKQLILLDTAGRSQHNQYQLNELKELLDLNAEIEKHLVISATTKYRDAVDILRKFAICDPDKILFTKVDETSSIGTIINLAYHYPITLSYLTNGQSVPDDIAIGDSECLAKMLLR